MNKVMTEELDAPYAPKVKISIYHKYRVSVFTDIEDARAHIQGLWDALPAKEQLKCHRSWKASFDFLAVSDTIAKVQRKEMIAHLKREIRENERTRKELRHDIERLSAQLAELESVSK